MSVSPAEHERDRPAEVLAGFMATAAIVAGLVAIVHRPVRIAPFAILIALVAAGIGGRHARLAGLAVAVATVGWLLGMTVSVLTDRPLY